MFIDVTMKFLTLASLNSFLIYVATSLIVFWSQIESLHSKEDVLQTHKNNQSPPKLFILYVLTCTDNGVKLNLGVARELVARGHQLDLFVTSSTCVQIVQDLVPGANEVIANDLVVMDSKLKLYPYDSLDSLFELSALTGNITSGIFEAVRRHLKAKMYDVVVGDEVLVGAVLASKVS